MGFYFTSLKREKKKWFIATQSLIVNHYIGNTSLTLYYLLCSKGNISKSVLFGKFNVQNYIEIIEDRKKIFPTAKTKEGDNNFYMCVSAISNGHSNRWVESYRTHNFWYLYAFIPILTFCIRLIFKLVICQLVLNFCWVY